MFESLVSIAVLVGISVLVVLLSDRIESLKYNWRNPPEKQAAERARHFQRLSAPDWSFYERHLERKAPEPLRELFANLELVQAPLAIKDLNIYISQFEPLDMEGLIDSKEWLGIEIVPFADSDGDLIYLKPGATIDDAVYITYHDGGDTEELVSDVAKFVRHVREARAKTI